MERNLKTQLRFSKSQGAHCTLHKKQTKFPNTWRTLLYNRTYYDLENYLSEFSVMFSLSSQASMFSSFLLGQFLNHQRYL